MNGTQMNTGEKLEIVQDGVSEASRALQGKVASAVKRPRRRRKPVTFKNVVDNLKRDLRYWWSR